jgi:hypothetical protein
MTIQQVVKILQSEKQQSVPSRFPCRAIMVKNINQYCQLLSELSEINDIRVVSSSEIFSSSDTMPKYENLMDESYQDEWLILTGISEYLRLFAKKEAVDRRFASLWAHQSSATSIGRILIPLWGCETQWFDPAINLSGDLRQQDFYFDCTEEDDIEQHMDILVLSGEFEQHISDLESFRGNLRIGLREWFEYWENPTPDNTEFVLLTKRHKSISSINGNISIRILKDTLSFIKASMRGTDLLSEENCPSEMQEIIFQYALKGISLEDALLNALNVSAFSGTDIMGKWSTLSDGLKQMVKFWYVVHPDKSYLCHCINMTPDIGSITDCIAHEIFTVRNLKPEWVAEYQVLSNILAIQPDDQFFDALNDIPEYDDRLDFLTNGTREERIYLLRLVGNWMRNDAEQVKNSKQLEKIYPELFAYLNYEVNIVNEDLGAYMSRYKAYKLENTLPVDEDTYFNQIQTDLYEYRYAVLADNIDSDTQILWIDALGVEWMPLLMWSITNGCDATIKNATVVMANLPTETCYNEQWGEMSAPYIKLDKLDKLAHKGVVDEPDYYSCIEEQLSFISKINKKVNEILGQHHRVIITGDHGTSRLAARFFHTRDGVPEPKGALVRSHGRYCVLDDISAPMSPDLITVNGNDGKKYAVFKNYDHFKQPGFAAGADDDIAIYGEVHGGATPEESLVPVIVVDSNKEIALSASWEKETVKIRMKKAKLSLLFNKPVSKLSVEMAGIVGETLKEDNGTKWMITIAGIKPGEHLAKVYVDGCIVSLPKVTIQSALGGDGDLP